MHFTWQISVKPFPGLRQKTFSGLFALCSFVAHEPYAQMMDDFSDGDFSAEPSWLGTTDHFIVNADFRLQLHSATAGTSWLSTNFSALPGADHEWEFLITQSFAPSGANFGRIYLFSNEADVSAALNGYYLQFGEPGSGDAIELFRQTGTVRESVCRATSGALASAFNIRVKVSRNHEGLWQLLADYSGGRDFVVEASGSDSTHDSGAWFGILCTYTVSNATRFYFDDFSIHTSVPPDSHPPEVNSVGVTSARTLELVFSEAVAAEAEDPSHYFVGPGHGHPESVSLRQDATSVVLTFRGEFQNGYEGTLRVSEVRDLAGNKMHPAELTFLYFLPQPVDFRDIIITEILADPSPQVGLPGEEFVEVLNRSAHPVQLDGWLFSDGSSTGRFPSYLLMPGKYLVVTPASAVVDYDRLAPAVGLANFPTLNNAGDRLLLRHSSRAPVDSVHYSGSWYRDADKAGGGWSLERIDPENLCADESNWTASENPLGGTPGRQNSVYATMPDNIGPKLISVVASEATVLTLTFDEKIENALPSPAQFTVVPFVAIQTVEFADTSLKRLTLLLSAEIDPRETYTLTASGIDDCSGNQLQAEFSSASFVLPQKANPGDMIVNEILFNPRVTGVDFIEIYNRSEKTIDLKGWQIRNVQSQSGKNMTVVSPEHALIAPGEYRVFTESTEVLKGEYVAGNEQAFRESDLPGFNDDEGSAVLSDSEGAVIDSMNYSAEMHSPFLKNKEGVSLERISLAWRADESANWRSAASTAGFATPGYANSTLRADPLIDEGSVIVEPEIIRSTGGFRDFAQIRYHFENGGLMANVKIFDQQGRAIREIAANQLLGTEGFFRWDGDRDDGTMARMGYYFVWFEIFDAASVVKTYKKRVVVF